MALVREGVKHAHRNNSNKEPEWNALCKDVFDQYLDDDPFTTDHAWHNRHSSQDSGLLLSSSGLSEQSICTAGTSPMPTPVHTAQLVHRSREVEARQPRVKAPAEFWDQTVKTLERNAAETETKARQLRTAKSHPDFLSLGGFPSPPAVPSPPTFQPLSVQRQRARVVSGSANGKKATQNRSVSRGRSTVGVTKSTPTHPPGTVRKWSISPTKMRNSSRYRPGVQELFKEHLQDSKPPVPPPQVPWAAGHWPMSPAASGCGISDGCAVAPAVPLTCPVPDGSSSPLAMHGQHQYIHDHHAMPTMGLQPVMQPNMTLNPANAAYHARTMIVQPPLMAGPVMPVQQAPAAFPARGSSLAAPKMQAFDFGFGDDPEFEPWATNDGMYAPGPEYATMSFPTHDTYSASEQSVMSMPQMPDPFYDASLGINYAPVPMMEAKGPIMQDNAQLSYTVPIHDGPAMTALSQRRSTPQRRISGSPPPPSTEPRSRRTNRSRSRSRAPSRHRRAKSIHAAPRIGPQSPEKGGLGGFVNYTAQDSSKLLSGVAPSGSSKTKARREKEAADRRRILSQAAVKAVVDAGGDLNALTAAGLFI